MRHLSRLCSRCLTVAIFALAAIISSPSQANPSSQHPEQELAAHGTIPGATELVEQLYALYAEEAKFVAQTYDRKDDPASFSDRQISRSAGRLWKGRRDAKRLQLMGEPAGHDLFKKLQMLAVEVYKFGQAYRGTPRGNQLAQRIQTKLSREKPQMQRFLQQAQNALQQGKLEIFATQMEKKGLELTEQLVFFNASGSRPFDEEFNATLARGDATIEKQRKSEYADQVSGLIARQLSLVEALGSEGQRIANEIAKQGTAELAGGDRGGPVEAFAYAGAQWGAASAALTRATALRWAFPAAQFPSSRDANSSTVAGELKKTALNALVTIVDATAESTSVEEVPAVFSNMLEAISVVDRRTGIMSQDVRNACRESMEKLAAKDPGLPARIDAYQRATAEVLRWRKTYTSQQTSHLAREAARANVVLGRKGTTDIQIRPAYARQPTGETSAAPSLFSAPADWMIQEASARLVGQAIIEDGAVRLSPASRVAVIPYSYQHYANLPVPLSSEMEVADLLAALVVDERYRPLTIDAADAVSAANLQDYETVIGEIDNLHLESIVTRMISLSDAAYPLVTLGHSVMLNDQVSPVEQTCWRLDLRPRWASQLYFTVSAASR